MSIEAIRWALKDAPGVPPTCLGVLIGLAEHADKQGCGAYPSIATLVGYTRKSERQVKYDLGVLTDAKLISRGNQRLAGKLPGNHRPVVYDLAMHRLGVQPIAPLDMQSTAPLEDPGVQPASPLDVQSTAPLGDVQSTAPLQAADLQERSTVQSTAPLGDDSQGCNTASAGVQPIAHKPSIKKTSSRRRDLNAGREDVERLCVHLADRVEANGSLRPPITEAWRDAARLMIDKGHRTEDQIHRAIDWSQDSEFWRANVMSMPKLREKYDQLRLQAKRELADQSRASQNGHRPVASAARVSPRDEHRLRR